MPLLYRHLADVLILGDEIKSFVEEFKKDDKINFTDIAASEESSGRLAGLLDGFIKLTKEIKNLEVGRSAPTKSIVDDLFEPPIGDLDATGDAEEKEDALADAVSGKAIPDDPFDDDEPSNLLGGRD